MTITVRYYAKLKEEAGLAHETFETQAATVGALWTEAVARHGFTIDQKLVKVAQGDEFCSWAARLLPGTVVFMPPVAGG